MVLWEMGLSGDDGRGKYYVYAGLRSNEMR